MLNVHSWQVWVLTDECPRETVNFLHSQHLLKEGNNFAWMAWQLTRCDMNKGQTEVYYENQNWDKDYFTKFGLRARNCLQNGPLAHLVQFSTV